jgi:hypothetical protein
MFPEGPDSKASAGYLYPIGGFCILDIVNPKPIPTAFDLGRGQPRTTEEVRHILCCILGTEIAMRR